MEQRVCSIQVQYSYSFYNIGLQIFIPAQLLHKIQDTRTRVAHPVGVEPEFNRIRIKKRPDLAVKKYMYPDPT